MKYYITLAIQLFFVTHIFAIVQPSLAQAKNYAKKTTWAFEENKGQVEGKDGKKVKYFYKQGNLTMFLMKGRLAYQFEQWHYPQDSVPEPGRRGWKSDEEEYKAQEAYQKKIKRETYRMDIELLGANKNCEIITEGKSHDYIQYYNHNALDVHAYQKITYKNIYPNIDWVIYQSQGASSKLLEVSKNSQLATSNSQLVKYDFIVHPGGDPSLIKLRTHWVEDLNIKPDGSLTLASSMGSITENPPISFQEGNEIATQFKREGNTLSFHLGAYDKSQTLVLDPSIAWSTYYGGANREHFNSCVVDKFGDVYAAGLTEGTTLITTGAHQTTYGGFICSFIVKFSSEGKRLWATYYGGNGNNFGHIHNNIKSLAIDTSNNLFLIGNTLATTNIATAGTYNQTKTSLVSSFLIKFNPNGIRQWGTYYDCALFRSIAIDKSSNIVCVGHITTNSSGVGPTAVGASHQSTHAGKGDGFITKFNQTGYPVWSSYYGGSREDKFMHCAMDKDENIYVVGDTKSENNISYNGFQNSKANGDKATAANNYTGDSFNENHFLVKFNTNGVRQWATYYGDTNFITPQYYAIDVDGEGNVYLGITTEPWKTTLLSNDFPNKAKGYFNNFIALLSKFNTNGNRLWSRFCLDTVAVQFPNSEERVTGVLVVDSNQILVYGFTTQFSTLKTTGGGWQNSIIGGSDGYIQAYDKNGYETWGSYLGGQGYDNLFHTGLSKEGSMYLTGITDSSNGQVSSTALGLKGFQNTFGGNSDGFLTKICTRLDTPKIEISSNRGTSICGGGQVIFTATDTFEGDDPQYQWYKNESPIGSDTNVLIMAVIQDQDSFKCRLISSATCLYKDTVWSNTIVMKIKAADTLHIPDTMCELQSYRFNNQNIYTSGIYRDTFTSSQGCDSFVFLHLHVKDTSRYFFSHVTPCDPNASYTFNGLARTQSGTYSAKYLNAVGCDSTAILNLTVRKPSSPFSFTQYICPGSSYVFNGLPRTSQGTYTQTFTNSQGCDSAVSLDLRVLTNPRLETNTIPACAPFTFRGKTYTTSTTVIDTIKSIIGNCDSVFRTNLIQLKPPATKAPDTNIIVCDSIRINNKLYAASFHLIDTFRTQGSTQCDSLYRKTNYIIRYTPQIGLKERDTFMRGAQITLRPFSTKNYLWSTGETTQSISFKLTEDRQFYLIAWNEEPCRDTAYISLVAEDLAIVGMPTGFSPNGEHSENRTLKPNVNGRLEYLHLMIFNRWGEKVYETFDTNPLGWNGMYKGEPAPAGLYGYVMEYRSLGSIFTKSGEVMLVW